jgi:hypothetical protein
MKRSALPLIAATLLSASLARAEVIKIASGSMLSGAAVHAG